jgi:hypothetical protein
MNQSTYSQFQKKYGGCFIARRGSKVLAWAPSLKKLRGVLRERGILHKNDVAIGYIDPRGAVCVYQVSLPV